MTYPTYYIALLNYINGRCLSDTSLPDSVNETEKDLMSLAYTQLGLLSKVDANSLSTRLGTNLNVLSTQFQSAHDELDVLRKHGVSLHTKETLWLDALDKALPFMAICKDAPWAHHGSWSPKDFLVATNPSEEEKTLHALLVALIQYSCRELHRTA